MSDGLLVRLHDLVDCGRHACAPSLTLGADVFVIVGFERELSGGLCIVRLTFQVLLCPQRLVSCMDLVGNVLKEWNMEYEGGNRSRIRCAREVQCVESVRAHCGICWR
jgi:hypothetical protein